MRTFIYIICLMVGCQVAVKAQEYDDPFFPMLQDGKKWVTIDRTHTYTHYIEGDTIIGDQTWKKVYANYYDQPEFSYYAAIREEGDKVYGIATGNEEQRLLYDFGLNVGDELMWKEEFLPDGMAKFYYLVNREDYHSVDVAAHRVTVEEIDTIHVHGYELRRLILMSNYGLKTLSTTPIFKYPYFVWIEGIGCEGGLFVSGRKVTDYCELYCMMNETVIFEYDDFHVPGISDGIQGVIPACHNENAIYDLAGRAIQQTQQKGIYIRNRRKYIAK